MGNFANNAITEAGRALLADVQAGAVFTPTRIVMGSGSMPTGTTTRNMTNVIAPVKSLAITKKVRTPDGKCIFGGVYTNEEITVAFYFRELALYAKAVYLNEDGSVQSEGAETLYSYGNAGDTADYMPAYSTSTVVERNMDLVTWVGNDAQVDLTVESGIYAPAGYGLGVPICPKIDTWDALDATVKNGWYYMQASTGGSGALAGIMYGLVRVCAEDAYYAVQEFYPANTNEKLERHMNVKTWGEWEWTNPPMVVGVEYRTTERRNGKAVYKMLGSHGVLKYRLEGETEWNIYAHENGAAPAELVYGMYDVSTDEDIDAVIDAEFAKMTDYSIRHICINDYVGTMFSGGVVHITINKTNIYYACVEAIKYHSNGVLKWRRSKYTTWQPWEWENPLLNTGIEYRTTERYQGYPVYKKVDTNGDILWRIEGETYWRLQSSANYVSAATVE